MNYEEARKNMVDSQVRPHDVTDLTIQNVLGTTPRELFLPAERRSSAYADCEVAYAPGRCLLRPRDFAKLLAAAAPKPSDLVLNAVCGSGYSTAVLAQMTEMVVSIENDQTLVESAEEILTKLDHSNVAVLQGDPLTGVPKQAPFDLIFVGGVIERTPDALLAQLKDNGRLATIVRQDGVSRGGIFRRSGDVFAFQPYFDAASVLIMPGFEAEKAFTF